MNWKQIHKSSTPEEELETLIYLINTIEDRKQRIIFSRGRLIREKRGYFPGAHFINDRRRQRPSLTRALALSSFAFILTTVSVATWLFAIHAPAPLAAAAISMHVVMLSLILYIKPYNIRLQTT